MGFSKKVGHYIVYSHVTFKTSEELEFQIFSIENFAIEEKMSTKTNSLMCSFVLSLSFSEKTF